MPIGLTRNSAKKDTVVNTNAIFPNSAGDSSVVATRIMMSASKTCKARPNIMKITFWIPKVIFVPQVSF